MSTTILNRIIALCVAGIVVLFIKDLILKPQSDTPPTSVQQTITTAPIRKLDNQDTPIPCSHPYFPFIEGTQWTYQMTSRTTLSGTKKESTRLLTNTLTHIGTSSAQIESNLQDDDSTKNVITMLYCKQSGIYGVPFPLSVANDDTTGTLINTLLTSFSSQLRLLPARTVLQEGTHWETPLSLNFGTSLFGTDSTVILVNKITDVSDQILFGKRRHILTVQSSYQVPIFTFQLAEGIGITAFDLDLSYKDIGDINLNLKLVRFSK